LYPPLHPRPFSQRGQKVSCNAFYFSLPRTVNNRRPIVGWNRIALPHTFGRVLGHADINREIGKPRPSHDDLTMGFEHVANGTKSTSCCQGAHIVPWKGAMKMATKRSVAERKKQNDDARRKEVGRRLRILRKAKFPNPELAFEVLQQAGFQRGLDSYKAYEKGARKIPSDEARLALQVFESPDGSFDWLFLGDEEPEWGSQTQRLAARPSLLMLPRLTAGEAVMIPSAFEAVKEKAKKENRLHPVVSRPGHEIGPKAYLMPIDDDSMIPNTPFEERRFLPGDDVLIDPDVKPRPGDFVAAHLKSEDTAVFRRWQESDGRLDAEKHFVLKPLNASYRTEVVNPKTNPARVIGCMIQHISYRR